MQERVRLPRVGQDLMQEGPKALSYPPEADAREIVFALHQMKFDTSRTEAPSRHGVVDATLGEEISHALAVDATESLLMLHRIQADTRHPCGPSPQV